MEFRGIYCITNTINSKKYIGSSVKVKGRLRQHKSDLKNKRHFNAHLQNSVNKYGIENFTFEKLYVTDQTISDSELRQIENKFCEQYNTYSNEYGYNLMVEHGNSRELTPEKREAHRQRIRQSHGRRAVLVDIKTHEKIYFDTLVDATNHINCSSHRFFKCSVADGYLHIREDDLKEIDNLHTFISNRLLANKRPGSPIPVIDSETGVFYNSIKEVCELYGFPKSHLIDYRSYKNFVVCCDDITDLAKQKYEDNLSRKLGNSLYKATTSILDLETGIYYYGYADARTTFGISKNLAKKFFTNSPRFLVETLKPK